MFGVTVCFTCVCRKHHTRGHYFQTLPYTSNLRHTLGTRQLYALLEGAQHPLIGMILFAPDFRASAARFFGRRFFGKRDKLCMKFPTLYHLRHPRQK